VTPSVAVPGDINPSDATGAQQQVLVHLARSHNRVLTRCHGTLYIYALPCRVYEIKFHSQTMR